jgi:hypothetical protein
MAVSSAVRRKPYGDPSLAIPSGCREGADSRNHPRWIIVRAAFRITGAVGLSQEWCNRSDLNTEKVT